MSAQYTHTTYPKLQYIRTIAFHYITVQYSHTTYTKLRYILTTAFHYITVQTYSLHYETVHTSLHYRVIANAYNFIKKKKKPTEYAP